MGFRSRCCDEGGLRSHEADGGPDQAPGIFRFRLTILEALRASMPTMLGTADLGISDEGAPVPLKGSRAGREFWVGPGIREDDQTRDRARHRKEPQSRERDDFVHARAMCNLSNLTMSRGVIRRALHIEPIQVAAVTAGLAAIGDIPPTANPDRQDQADPAWRQIA